MLLLTLAVSEPVSEPAPFYQPEADCVLAWHDASYSQHSWQLPRLLLPHPDEPSRAAVFAAALLAGKVLPCMAGLAGVLVAPAATAARQELQGLPRVGELLTALQTHKVRLPAVQHIVVLGWRCCNDATIQATGI
jgi:ATP-dependent RNA helicase DHX37/DHR1